MTSRRNNPNNYGGPNLAERYASSEAAGSFESGDLLAAYNDPSVQTKTGDPASDHGYSLPGTFQTWKENYSKADPATDQRAMRFAQDTAVSAVNHYLGLDRALRHEIWKDNALSADHGALTAAQRHKLVERLSQDRKVDSDCAAAAHQLKQANPEHWQRDATRAMLEHRDTLEVAHQLAYVRTKEGSEEGLDHARDGLDNVQHGFAQQWKEGLKNYGVQPTPNALGYTANTEQEAENRVSYVDRISDRLGFQGDDRRVANSHTADIILERDLAYLKQANGEQLEKGGNHQYSGVLKSINDRLESWAGPAVQDAKEALTHERHADAVQAYQELQDTARDIANVDYLFKHPDSKPTEFLTQTVEKETSSFKKQTRTGNPDFILTQVEYRLTSAPGGGIKDALKEQGIEEVQAAAAHLAEYHKQSTSDPSYASLHYAAAIESFEKAVMLKHLAEGNQLEQYRKMRLTEERAMKEAASYSSGNTATMDAATIIYAKESGQTPQCADTLAARHQNWSDPRTEWETTWEKRAAAVNAADRPEHLRAMGFATDTLAATQQNTENLTHLVKEDQNQASWPATPPTGSGLKGSLKKMLGMAAQGGSGDPAAAFKQRYPTSYREEADALQQVSDDLLTVNRVLAYEAILRGDRATLEQVREAARQVAYSHNEAVTDSPDRTVYHWVGNNMASWTNDPYYAAHDKITRHQLLAYSLSTENQAWMSASDQTVMHCCLADQAANRDVTLARQKGAELLHYTPEGKHSAAAAELMNNAIEAKWLGQGNRADQISYNLQRGLEAELANCYEELQDTTYGVAAVCQALEDQNSSLNHRAYRIAGIHAATLAEHNAQGDRAGANYAVEHMRNMLHNTSYMSSAQTAVYHESLRHLDEVDRYNGMHHAGLASPAGEPSHRANAQYHMQIAGMLHYFAGADVYEECVNNSALRMMGGNQNP